MSLRMALQNIKCYLYTCFYGLSLGMTAPRYFLASALHMDNEARDGIRTHIVFLLGDTSPVYPNFTTLA